jgi:hypothetical protein
MPAPELDRIVPFIREHLHVTRQGLSVWTINVDIRPITDNSLVPIMHTERSKSHSAVNHALQISLLHSELKTNSSCTQYVYACGAHNLHCAIIASCGAASAHSARFEGNYITTYITTVTIATVQ